MTPNWSVLTSSLLPCVFFTISPGASATLGRQVEIKCPQVGEYRHGLPMSKCRQYYVCKGFNDVTHRTCPAGTYYSPTLQGCKVGGNCYDVVCTGRVDGRYADTTEGCSRWFECLGGAVEGVESCPLGYNFSEARNRCVPAVSARCNKPKLASSLVVKVTNPCDGLPDGYFPVHGSAIHVKCINQVEVETHTCPTGQKFDGHSCSRQHRNDACSSKSDGYHIVDSVQCTEYVFCKNHETVLRSKCPYGTSFDGKSCSPHRFHSCLAKKDSKCSGLSNGYYPNVYNNCGSFFYCNDGILVTDESCPQGLLWDGTHCTPYGDSNCIESNTSNKCLGKKGYITDGSSKCHKYHYCQHGTKMTFLCPIGQIFNGSKCVSTEDYKCPERDENSCDGKPSGYYIDTESNCQSYYYCANGNKIVYVCPPNEIFDGSECVTKERFECPSAIHNECADRPNGYQRDRRTLRDYIYCYNGVKLVTLQCGQNEVYDGEKCVNISQYKSKCHNVIFGHITDSSCRVYYLCRDGSVIKSGVCLDGLIFDGQSCVPHTHGKCDRGSIKSCAGSPNGFYADFNTDCRQYSYCINGQNTQLYCPQGQVHNGDLCIPEHQYTCPSLAVNNT